MTNPVCTEHIRSDRDPYLSIDCTVRCILENEQTSRLVQPLIMRAKNRNGNWDGTLLVIEKKSPLKILLQTGGIPEKEIQMPDRELNTIPNKHILSI